MDTSGVVTYDKSWCVQLDQSKMCLITIVFRSWSCSFPPVEVVDQWAVQNSQTVLVALLSLMLLAKVSNADSRGESSVCSLYPWSFLCPLFGRTRVREHRVYLTAHTKHADISYTFQTRAVFHTRLAFLQFISMKTEWVMCFPCRCSFTSE